MFSMYFCFMLQSEYNTVVKFITPEPGDCEEVEAVPVGWLFSAENSLLLAPMKSDAAISRPVEYGVPRGLK